MSSVGNHNHSHGHGAFKKVLDGTECRRSREETSIQLRKNKKEEMMRKKRFGNVAIIPNEGGTTINTNGTNVEIVECMEVFQTWYRTSRNNNSEVPIDTEEELFLAAKKIRRMLSDEKNAPVQEVLTAGILLFLVEMLHEDVNSKLMFEAAWALTNIASSEYTNWIVQYPNCVDRLTKLLVHDVPDVREQAAWCLGNIAGDKIQYRDMLLNCTDNIVVAGMAANLSNPHSKSLLSNVAWSVSNLCRGKPQPDLSLVRPFIVPLFNVMKTSIVLHRTNMNEDSTLQEMITDAMWCMSYISDGDNSRIQVVLDDTDNEFVDCIKDIIHESFNVSGSVTGLLIPSIRCLGNLVSGTNEQTSIVVDSGVLKLIPRMLEFQSNALKKEICWMLSNVAAGTDEHIDAIFRAEHHGGLVRSLIKMASSETMNVRKEAVWAICNIVTTSKTARHYNVMIQYDVIDPLCAILAYKEDVKLLLVVMDALDVILTKNEERQACHDQIVEEYQGVERLELLQEHASDEVYLKAVSLIERFFGGEDMMEDDQNLMPSQNDTTFEFSVPKELFPDSYSNQKNKNLIAQIPFQPVVFNFGIDSNMNVEMR